MSAPRSSPHSVSRRRAWLASFAAVLIFNTAGQAAEVPIKVIDGRPVARCTIHGGGKSVPANLVIDLGMRMPLVVHKNTGKMLALGPGSNGEVRFGEMVLPDLRTLAADLPSLEELNVKFAPDLDEIPAVGILGLPAFAGQVPQLDLAAGVLRLIAPGDLQMPPVSTATGAGGPEPVDVVLPLEEQGSGYWLSAMAAEDFKIRVRLSTSAADTVLDSTTSDLAGSPAGALDELWLGPINLARYVAFRPQDLSGYPDPRPDLITGTVLLSHFRVTIDMSGRRIRFERTREPSFPTEERAYYVAVAAGDAQAIEAFLRDHPTSRLAAEASEKLLALRLEQTPPDAEGVLRALRSRAGLVDENRRAATMVMLADELLASEREDRFALAGKALEIGRESASADLNAVAVHQINARLGLLALQRDDLQAARRFLLSAAFGMPRDPLVNLWLGQFYERSGKLRRAWSRYVQASLDRHPPAESFVGLNRLNRNPEFRREFGMNDARELLEGRIPEFHPADRYAAERTPGKPVALVELFTCIDHPQAGGPELAFDGLGEYFANTAATVLVQYHLASPGADPLVSDAALARAARYAVTTAPAAIFDGGAPDVRGGSDKDAPALFGAYLKAALARQADSPWRITGQAQPTANGFAGRVRVAGPHGGDHLRLELVLCEQTVMAPGASALVLHNRVARALLSPKDGLRIPSSGQSSEFEFTGSWPEITAGLERSMSVIEDQLDLQFVTKPSYVDPAACSVVAILYDQRDGRVFAAADIPVPPPSTGSAPS